ncbi:MAG: SIMPL domain-containing protein, partial [Cyclobacteriaceae bacterium]
MKSIIFCLCLGLTISISASAQRGASQKLFKSANRADYDALMLNSNSGNQQQANSLNFQHNNSRMVILESKVLMNVEANRFLAVFNLTQIGKSAVETDALINKRIEGFITDLQKLSVSEEDIYTDMIYLIPTFEFEVQKKIFSSDTYNEVPTGFEMQKNVHVSFDNIKLIDDLVTLAAKNEIYDLVKVDFFVDDAEQVYDSIRSRALSLMDTKITDYSAVTGMELKGKFYAMYESSDAIYPESRYSGYDA